MNCCYTAEYFIDFLHMSPHNEGGYFKEQYKSDISIKTEFGDRKISSSIYFLLACTEVSVFHVLRSDELWYYHVGCPLTIYMITPSGELLQKRLGLNIDCGEYPQLIVPKGTIFGALPEGDSFSLSGCMVSPAFEYEDFRIISRRELLNNYPQYWETILLLTKPD